MRTYLETIGKKAQKAFEENINTKIKNKVLIRFSNLIKKNQLKIINANKKDISFAVNKKIKENLIKIR